MHIIPRPVGAAEQIQSRQCFALPTQTQNSRWESLSYNRRVTSTALARRAVLLSALLALLIPVLVVISCAVGTLDISVAEAAKLVVGHLVPGRPWMSDGSLTAAADQAVWEFRLPRALLAAVVGAALALAGALLQVVVRNPLAEPYVLGISSGAGLGAVLVIVLGSAAVGGLSLGSAAFVGAILATFAVHVLAAERGTISPQRLILAGVALGTLLSAVTNYFTISTEAQNVFSVMYFMLGSLSAATYAKILGPLLALALVFALSMARSRTLNAMLVGDDAARSIGVDANKVRTLALVGAALLTAVSVAVAGGIAFVGLVVPHVARMAVGSDHRRMLPLTATGGAAFLMLCDLAARCVADPVELPIGIVTACIGAPFFLWILRSRSSVRGVSA